MFEKASIPTVSEYRIVQLITEYHDRYYNLRKSYNRDRNKASFKQTFDDIKHKSTLLFDVAACQCYAIVVDCTSKKYQFMSMPDFCKLQMQKIQEDSCHSVKISLSP